MDIQERAAAMAEKMSTQLRVGGDGLADVTARAGRKLPKHLQREAATMIEALSMASHPRLSRLVDMRRVLAAEKRLNKFLEKQNPAAERRGEILDFVAKIAFVLVTVVLSVFFLLLWRGYFD